jgi:uncharacterized membrane protein
MTEDKSFKGPDAAVALAGCGVALGTLAVVALFQSGVVDRLPDPAGEVFASERITLSKMAHPLGIPDSYLGLGSYGATLGLMLKARNCDVARRALGFKLMVDGSMAGFNAVRQVVRFGKLCSWCTGTALATAVMVYGGRKAIAGAARSVTAKA